MAWLAWVNTGVLIPGNTWTHVAVVYDHGLVKTYVNGRSAHALQPVCTLTAGIEPVRTTTRQAPISSRLMAGSTSCRVVTAAFSATEIEAIALAGSGSCTRGRRR
jgi:hypothetical protein